mmetsp:Transcript_76941/g.124498  ORF Transcript_76941/g.124498 Transcript_76941/m.124498 type:complete len:201 (+) Transcript_76941:536-1138(+)
MPRIEGVQANHVEPSLRNGATVGLEHLIHVLVMAPRQHQLRDATARLIDAVGCAIHGMRVVWVLFEGLGEHDGVLCRGTADRKGVTHHRPLLELGGASHPRQSHHLAQVVQQPHEVEPVVLLVGPLFADALCCLEVVDAVREIDVWVRVIHQVVQHLNNLHDRKLALVKLQPVGTLLLHKLHGLLAVHRIVSLGDLCLPN